MSLREWVPGWWEGKAGLPGSLADVALAPAELAYRGVVAARNRAYAAGFLRLDRPPIPVLSVGNVSVGGAGKTPVAAWLAARLRAEGRRPAIALRGYGADEVMVHRELNPQVPVFAAARRVRAVREAAAAGCDCAVLDDGFQHRALDRALDIVLLPVESWTAQPRLLPRGPWREPPESLRRADLVLLTRKSAGVELRDAVWDEVAELLGPGGPPLAACAIQPTRLRPLHPGRRTQCLDWLRGRAVVAVAALAAPRPFLDQLAATGAEVEPLLYPDHHDYSAADSTAIAGRAGGRPVVTTLKDAVKLRSLLGAEVATWVVHQAVSIELGEDIIDAALRGALEAAPG